MSLTGKEMCLLYAWKESWLRKPFQNRAHALPSKWTVLGDPSNICPSCLYLGVVLWDSICLFVAWIHETCFVTEWSPQNCNQETVNSPMACPKASGAQLCFRFPAHHLWENYTTVDPKQLHKSHKKFLRQAQTTDTSWKTRWETRPDTRPGSRTQHPRLKNKLGDWETSWETRQTQDQGAGHSIPGWRTSWETGRQDKHKTREPDTASQAEEQAGRLGDKLRDKTGNKTKTRPGSRTQHPRLKNKLADWETSSETRPGSRTQHPRLKNKLGDWETSWETRQTQDQGAGHSIPGWRTSWQTGRQDGRQDLTQDQGAGHSIPGWRTSWETGRQVGRQDKDKTRVKNKLGDWETSWETRPGSRAQHPRLKIKLFGEKTETNLHKCM